MSHLLVTENLVKNYQNKRALNNVSITVPKGVIFGLLGPNGAGKTTLIRVINQIIIPDQGHVVFDGEPLRPGHVRDMGYLPEERGLYKSMKVGEQLLYLAQLKGLSKPEAKKRINYRLERFEITDWGGKKIQELSKGMAQKIQFIATVLHRPKLLIFDEPFSGLDPLNANLIKNEILELRKQGATIIVSTHRMESVEELCDQIVLINKSNKILEGNLIDIKRTFKSNVYEVGLVVEDKASVRKKLEQKFETSTATFKTINDELQLNIRLPDSTENNELVTFLMSQGKLTRFVEVVPSVNDIFLQKITNS